jgi:hypothetical protein
VVGRQGGSGDEHLDRHRDTDPVQRRRQPVGEHVGGVLLGPGAARYLDEQDRLRQRPGRGPGGGDPPGQPAVTALGAVRGECLGDPGGETGRLGLGDEPVRGAVLGGGGGQRVVGVEVDPQLRGRRHDGLPDPWRQHRAVGDEGAGEQLERLCVLPDGDELAGRREQVVVHPTGEREQQLVRGQDRGHGGRHMASFAELAPGHIESNASTPGPVTVHNDADPTIAALW